MSEQIKRCSILKDCNVTYSDNSSVNRYWVATKARLNKQWVPIQGIVVAAEDFYTLAQRLQEAERLLSLISSKGLSPSLTDVELEEIDAFLAGKGGKA